MQVLAEKTGVLAALPLIQTSWFLKEKNCEDWDWAACLNNYATQQPEHICFVVVNIN